MKEAWNTWAKKFAKSMGAGLTAFLVSLLCVGCSSTRASILTAKDSATTTITITTNNPVSATTEAKADLNLSK